MSVNSIRKTLQFQHPWILLSQHHHPVAKQMWPLKKWMMRMQCLLHWFIPAMSHLQKFLSWHHPVKMFSSEVNLHGRLHLFSQNLLSMEILMMSFSLQDLVLINPISFPSTPTSSHHNHGQWNYSPRAGPHSTRRSSHASGPTGNRSGHKAKNVYMFFTKEDNRYYCMFCKWVSYEWLVGNKLIITMISGSRKLPILVTM